MSCTIKKLPKGAVEISCEIPVEEAKNELESAARHLSEERQIQGYRPGKAPYDVVKTRFGEMAIYEHALPDLVRTHYVKAVMDNALRAYGEPRINVTKLVPGNPIAFTATVALVPAVLSLADFRTIKVKTRPVAVETKRVDETLKELQRMQTKEVRANREARVGDKIVVDMNLSRGGVGIEGGQTKGHGIYLDEDYYVPGFREQVVGLKEGDKKTFTLKFPDTHYQKNIAGQDVDFAVTLNEVYELRHPALDDEFAKRLGQESMEKLSALLNENLVREAEAKERQRVELEILEKLVDKSKFEEFPDAIITAEVDRMLEELKRSVTEQGADFAEYLKNIKKSVDELKLEFAVQAVKRVKTAILLRELAEKEHVEVSDAELLAEVTRLLNAHANSAETQAEIRTEEYHDYLRTSLRNRKVIEMLREAAMN